MGYKKMGYIARKLFIIMLKIRLFWARYRTRKALKRVRKGWNVASHPLSGKALDRYAKDYIGIYRRWGETDEELRLRCISIMRKGYEGTAVIPNKKMQQFIEQATQQIAVAAQVPVNVLTGEWKQENDPKQEGDA